MQFSYYFCFQKNFAFLSHRRSEMELINIFVRKDFWKNKALMAENDVKDVWYYCKYCGYCEIFYAIRNELKKKSFNSFNKNVPFWNVYKDCFRIQPLP